MKTGKLPETVGLYGPPFFPETHSYGGKFDKKYSNFLIKDFLWNWIKRRSQAETNFFFQQSFHKDDPMLNTVHRLLYKWTIHGKSPITMDPNTLQN